MKIIDAFGQPLANDFNRSWREVGEQLASQDLDTLITDDAPIGLKDIATYVPGAIMHTPEFEALDEATQELVARFVLGSVQYTLGVLIESAKLIDLDNEFETPEQ